MLEFQPVALSQKEQLNPILYTCGSRGCAYSFANLYMWGRQSTAVVGNTLVFFSQFSRRSVYLFPAGSEDMTRAVDALIHDAAKRGIPCRIIGLTEADCEFLEQAYPGRFRFHIDRDGFDYIYAIDDLADLKGKKYQKKRNHLNRFRQLRPDARLVPITEENLPIAEELAAKWYALRQQTDPHGDYLMEQAALKKALHHFRELGMEGLLLLDGQTPLAMTMGSPLSADTFDIHFEKALDADDGSYAAINQGFANYLRQTHPQLKWLNREDDMGLEGLRKAKLSYYPDHMIEQRWACLLEDGYDY